MKMALSPAMLLARKCLVSFSGCSPDIIDRLAENPGTLKDILDAAVDLSAAPTPEDMQDATDALIQAVAPLREGTDQ